MKRLLLILWLIVISGASRAQIDNTGLLGVHFSYSASYKQLGGGLYGGTIINNNYIGATGYVYPKGSIRYMPKGIGLEYGRIVNTWMPSLYAGYYTAGREAVKEGEATEGFEYGVSLSRIGELFNRHVFKYTAGASINSHGKLQNAFISFSIQLPSKEF